MSALDKHQQSTQMIEELGENAIFQFSPPLVRFVEFILAHDIVLIFVRSGGLDNGYENSKWKTLEEPKSIFPLNKYHISVYQHDTLSITHFIIPKKFSKNVAISTVGLLLFGKWLEPLWGSKEFLKFIIVVNLLTSICVFVTAIALYYITRQESYLYTAFSGFHGVLSGFLVGMKQILPDQELSLFILKIKAKVYICNFQVDANSRCIDLSCHKLLHNGFCVLPSNFIIWHIYELDILTISDSSADTRGDTLDGSPMPGSDSVDAIRRRISSSLLYFLMPSSGVHNQILKTLEYSVLLSHRSRFPLALDSSRFHFNDKNNLRCTCVAFHHILGQDLHGKIWWDGDSVGRERGARALEQRLAAEKLSATGKLEGTSHEGAAENV
ncbi:hypothetical protein C4D60_Mb07t26710 [Musa balbisiana]|uniref:Uncharacterized protein n=1 Tax=Musa balbisiana TaxID=52838 RepID=A0A4S8JKP8_MUSBA|nr:hypothetical protein C4D60_Mb07t26710 [Musa balbisiana]